MAEPTNVDPAKEAADGRRRVMILLGIGVGLLAAAFLLPKILFGGGDDVSTDSSTPPVASSTPGAVAMPGGSPNQAGAAAGSTSTTVALGALPESYEVFATRNPFTPLVSPSSTPAGDGLGDAGTETGAGTNPPAPDNGTEPRTQQQVALLDVAGASDSSAVATVTVDGVVYQVRVNEIFATNYKVVSIDLGAGCAGFLLGDDAFSLCRGEEIKK